MYQTCPVCNKPHCISGSGPITNLKIPFGGMCRCGGVAGLVAERDRLRGEVERLSAAAKRYEIARRLNPVQWAAAFELNISTGKPFDEIIDDMGPFV